MIFDICSIEVNFVRMLSRAVRQIPPVVRVASQARARHFLVPREFRAFDRLVEDFFRDPFFAAAPRLMPRNSAQMMESMSDVPSSFRFFKENGKFVAQMDLPADVKPEDVKVRKVDFFS